MAFPIRRVHSLSAVGFTGLGIPLNALLLWLIPRCTEEEMRTYSGILIQTSVSDIVYIVVSALMQYVFRFFKVSFIL